MNELSATDAGKIIGVNRVTIHNYIKQGKLKAERRGIQRAVRIKVDDLREFAQTNNYMFDEEILKEVIASHD